MRVISLVCFYLSDWLRICYDSTRLASLQSILNHCVSSFIYLYTVFLVSFPSGNVASCCCSPPSLGAMHLPHDSQVLNYHRHRNVNMDVVLLPGPGWTCSPDEHSCILHNPWPDVLSASLRTGCSGCFSLCLDEVSQGFPSGRDKPITAAVSSPRTNQVAPLTCPIA